MLRMLSFSRVCMVRAFELHYVLHESRYQILLFSLCYGYQLLIDDIYDFLDCVINSTRCFFAYNFELEIHGNSFLSDSFGDIDAYNIGEIYSQRNAQPHYCLLPNL